MPTETSFDAPEVQMYGVSSGKDKAFWSGLDGILADYPHSQRHW